MQFVNRADFGWGPSGASYAKPTRGLVIHYDGSDQGLADKPHSACVAYWKNTRRFHTGTSRQWVDIGYSFGACPHGFVFEGRGLNKSQAAQPTGNTTYYSCTLMSGPGEKPTPAQIEAVRELRAWLMSKGVGGLVKGHRDFYSTSCPGDDLYRLVKDGTFSKPPTSATGAEEDDDMASPKDVWNHEIKVPWGTKDNPEWQADSLLVEVNKKVRDLEAKVDALTDAVQALTDR
ncbi:peptidoglycan recognition protein family protein [Nonomuraea gerenzanensis]|uniref:N-acetylmuramoyl-L-alanine amidase n=1 Tax=Nonomuraea gerenzanensis TaxID=93944 RepID=A0A1M4BLB1_9ACTN|nr:peptidoglycan recognition family protein [Nonomuraea gerenzanensis]UBU10044.1 peptidoglycan recognition protein family protein [Nonomuraea gerenzanensis]SAP16332.1 hypothetical protein BN4615_P10995 [Nonomuraea gerenzanensis]